MADEISVRICQRIEPEEKKSLDSGLRGQTAATPQQDDGVQGQEYWYQQASGCPWCGAVNWLWLSDGAEPWFTCWKCGQAFRV